MLQNISISDEWCSFKLSIQRILKIILLRCFQHNTYNNVFEQHIRILEWFLKDHVTGVMMLKSSFEITGISYILKYIQNRILELNSKKKNLNDLSCGDSGGGFGERCTSADEGRGAVALATGPPPCAQPCWCEWKSFKGNWIHFQSYLRIQLLLLWSG